MLFCDSRAFPWLWPTLVKSGVYQRLLVGQHLRRRDGFYCRTWGRRLIPGVLCACSDREVWLFLKAEQKLVAHSQDSGKHLPSQPKVTGCVSSSLAGPGCPFPGEEWQWRGWDTHGFTGMHWFGTTAPVTTFSPLPRDDADTLQCQCVRVFNTGSFPPEHWCAQPFFPKKTGTEQDSPKAHSKL